MSNRRRSIDGLVLDFLHQHGLQREACCKAAVVLGYQALSLQHRPYVANRVEYTELMNGYGGAAKPIAAWWTQFPSFGHGGYDAVMQDSKIEGPTLLFEFYVDGLKDEFLKQCEQLPKVSA